MSYIHFPLLMPFLYSPDDNTEYIPAILTMIGFLIIAILAFVFIKKTSKKQEERFNEEYGSALQEKKQNDQNE